MDDLRETERHQQYEHALGSLKERHGPKAPAMAVIFALACAVFSPAHIRSGGCSPRTRTLSKAGRRNPKSLADPTLNCMPAAKRSFRRIVPYCNFTYS